MSKITTTAFMFVATISNLDIVTKTRAMSGEIIDAALMVHTLEFHWLIGRI